jgi:hypothetical protein
MLSRTLATATKASQLIFWFPIEISPFSYFSYIVPIACSSSKVNIPLNVYAQWTVPVVKVDVYVYNDLG